MALKDKLMTLEDFKAVRDVDVASNSAQFTEIKADLDSQAGTTGMKVLTDYTAVTGCIISTTGLFRIDGTRDTSAEYAVSNGLKLYVKANSSKETILSFLKTSTTLLENGDTPDYCDGEELPRKVLATEEEIFDIPSDCAYISFTVKASNKGSYLPNMLVAYLHTDYPNPVEKVDEVVAQTETVNNYYNDVIAGYETDLTDQVKWSDKAGVQYAGGGTSSSTTSKRTDYIDISSYDFLEYTMPAYTGSSSYGTAFYDENQNYITGINAVTGAEEIGVVVRYIRMRDDVKYMRTTYHRDSVYSGTEFYLKGYKIAEAVKPGYVRPFLAEEIADTVAKIKASQDEPNLSFWWFTDVHYYSNNFMVQGCLYIDMVNSIKAMDKDVQMDFVLDTGDLHDGDKNRVEHTTRIEEMMQKLSEVGLPVIRSIGNHDMHYSYSSNADPYDYKDQFKYYLARTKQASGYLFDTYGTSFYIDFDELKIRMIVVNTNNATGGEYHFDISAVNTWIQNVALETPDGYEVLFVAHLAPLNRHNKYNSPYGGSAFSTMMEAYETETKKLVGIIYGHTHWDATFAEPYLAVASCCEKYQDMDADLLEDGWLYPAKARHDVSEQCFNAVILKPLSKVMDVIRFGAGYDRKLHYDLNTVTVAGTLEIVPTINAVTWESLDTTICTVSEGAVTGVATGMTGIRAYDADGNFEMWRISVVN